MQTYSATEQLLQDFHTRNPGATSALLAYTEAHVGTRRYPSPYAALAACVPPDAGTRTVLDLACGDGYLLGLLAARGDTSLNLIGIDMSEAELDAARARLPHGVTLLREKAQQLPLASGSVDYVLSHMALMLMDDLEQVLREIRRVLHAGGTLAAVVGRQFLLGEVDDIFKRLFLPLAKEHLALPPFGDKRTRTAEGWMELLRADFAAPTIEDLDAVWHPTLDEFWRRLLETYDIPLLPAAAQAQLRAQLTEALAPLRQADGTIATGWGLRLVQARAA